MLKNAMAWNAPIATDAQGSGINKGNPSASPTQAQGINPKQSEDTRQELNEARVADQAWEFGLQIDLYVLGVVILKITVSRLMKMNHNGHHFTFTKLALPEPLTCFAD